MIDNPIHTCLFPRKVVNPYTHEMILVGCNHCPACANKRASRYRRLCELESIGEFSECFFCTLTYDNENIPLAQLVESEDKYFYNAFALNRQTDTEFLNEETFYLSDDDITKYQIKMKYFDRGQFSFLYYPDVQLFLKRLRKLYFKKYGEFFRFFITGEYGPTTLRAHWHLILFTKKGIPPLTKKDILQVWKFGRVDFDFSRGGCISYAASYANSVMSLPSYYKMCKVQNVNRHSIQLGGETYISSWLNCSSLPVISRNKNLQQTYENIFSPTVDEQGDIKCVSSLSFVIGGQVKNFPIDKTFSSRLFPRQYSFTAHCNDESILQYYRIYYIFRDFLTLNGKECPSVKDMVFLFLDYCLANPDVDNVITQTFHYLNLISADYLCEEGDFKTAFSRCYRFFLQSKNSFKYFDIHNIKKIIQSYEKKSLSESLAKQQELIQIKSDGNYTYNPCLFYAETFDSESYIDSDIYSCYKNEHDNIHLMKLIKKRFNDNLNLI